ncbi:MAG: MarR family transcriptional regulator [Kangiellaceae bacterium]|jgi:DNA-binding MarR family transcriptional regulator
MKLYQQLDLLSRKLRQLEQKDDTKELSSAKLTVLQMVKRYNPSTLKDLAKHQNVALPTMSKIVDELQKRSLIIRAQSKEDARQRWIVPTQKGIQLLERAESENDAYWQQKFSHLTAQQQRQLSESLDTLLQSL